MKITVYLASSVNGMISNKKNVPDWLSPEYSDGFMSICRETQAVIMGKTTYNILAPDYLPLKKNEGTMIVMSHDTSVQSSQSNLIFTDKSPEDVVAILQERGHKDAVIIGGTLTVSEFFKAGLVNELRLVVEPVLFGGGLPLIQDAGDEYELTLLNVRKLNENSVLLQYKVN